MNNGHFNLGGYVVQTVHQWDEIGIVIDTSGNVYQAAVTFAMTHVDFWPGNTFQAFVSNSTFQSIACVKVIPLQN